MIAPGAVVGVSAGDDFIGYTKSGPVPDCSIVRYHNMYVVNCGSNTGVGVPVTTALSADIKIFPNPATAELTITCNTNIHDISIANTVGETVYKNAFGETHVTLNIANLSLGIYFIKINGVEVRKFIKE